MQAMMEKVYKTSLYVDLETTVILFIAICHEKSSPTYIFVYTEDKCMSRPQPYVYIYV